jgi:hypothetical protein
MIPDPNLVARNIAALEAFYGVVFGYDSARKRYIATGSNSRVLMSVGTIGNGELFGFSGPDELMPDRPTADVPSEKPCPEGWDHV